MEIVDAANSQTPECILQVIRLLTEAKWKQWSPGEFYPYLDVVFDAFGTDRLMFGSDWPVILLQACMYNGKVCWRNTWRILYRRTDRKYSAIMPSGFIILINDTWTLVLKDKIIIVSGGARGIGEGIVKLLATEGAVPVIIGEMKMII
jgi:hypothetical protein